MRKLMYISVMLFALLFFSCKKDSDDSSTNGKNEFTIQVGYLDNTNTFVILPNAELSAYTKFDEQKQSFNVLYNKLFFKVKSDGQGIIKINKDTILKNDQIPDLENTSDGYKLYFVSKDSIWFLSGKALYFKESKNKVDTLLFAYSLSGLLVQYEKWKPNKWIINNVPVPVSLVPECSKDDYLVFSYNYDLVYDFRVKITSHEGTNICNAANDGVIAIPTISFNNNVVYRNNMFNSVVSNAFTSTSGQALMDYRGDTVIFNNGSNSTYYLPDK
jgi:hypothetical protein